MSDKTVKPVGEWNKAEIVKKGEQLDLYLNGEKVVSTKLGDDNWKKVIAGSKFKEMADFATFKNGHIAIQDHGDRVWFRNIKIKKF
ncbi:MAG: 3-keto-disaccharide hydrolase [Chitinophagaceae bacterium]